MTPNTNRLSKYLTVSNVPFTNSIIVTAVSAVITLEAYAEAVTVDVKSKVRMPLFIVELFKLY